MTANKPEEVRPVIKLEQKGSEPQPGIKPEEKTSTCPCTKILSAVCVTASIGLVITTYLWLSQRNSSVLDQLDLTNAWRQDFVVVKQLGSGSFGTVDLLVHHETGCYLTLKKMKGRPGRCGHVEEKRLRSEVATLKTLNHKHIVRYLGCYENGDASFGMFLEYVAGGTLQELVEVQRYTGQTELPMRLVQRYAREILLGLKYLHGQKIVHRDLKPDNILITATGTLKIADFGHCTTLEDAPPDEEHGCFQYRAPEVFGGCSQQKILCDSKVDIWSFGLVLIALATGPIRFGQIAPGMDAVEFRSKARRSLDSYYGYTEYKLTDLILSCLQVDPKERPSASDLLKHEFLTKTCDVLC